jgi:hypothetical protein
MDMHDHDVGGLSESQRTPPAMPHFYRPATARLFSLPRRLRPLTRDVQRGAVVQTADLDAPAAASTIDPSASG